MGAPVRPLMGEVSLMGVLVTILIGVAILSILVYIHEGGHYIAARAFGVRVTELMLGMPGPSIGFTAGGTRFGVTPILLGGYARICGMEGGRVHPHAQDVLAALYRRGTANMEDIAADCRITDDEAYDALEQLAEWGSVLRPEASDVFNTYRTPALTPSKKELRRASAAGMDAPRAFEKGEAREVFDALALYESEYAQQYRALPIWKRCIILAAGPAVNLMAAFVIFVIIYSVMGLDLRYTDTGEVFHHNFAVHESLLMCVNFIGMVLDAIAGLFNPATVADTVSNSMSIVGIVAVSGDYFSYGLRTGLLFVANIAISLGLMNLLPIPPLDGGKLLIELIQKVFKREVPPAAVNAISFVGIALFMVLFVVLVGQDIQRIATGFFG